MGTGTSSSGRKVYGRANGSESDEDELEVPVTIASAGSSEVNGKYYRTGPHYQQKNGKHRLYHDQASKSWCIDAGNKQGIYHCPDTTEDVVPIEGGKYLVKSIEGWKVSNAPVLSQAVEKAELDNFVFAAQYMEYGCCHCAQDEQEQVPVVQQALLSRRPVWSGVFLNDYFFHVTNNHPLVSIFCCSPMHPYSKMERFSMLLIVSMATISWTAMLLKGWAWTNDQIQDVDFNQCGLCVGMLVLINVTIPMMLFEMVCHQFAVLDVYFKDDERKAHGCLGGCLGHIGNCFAKCCEGMETVCFGCCAFLTAIPAAIVLYIMCSTGQYGVTKATLYAFGLSRLQAWVFWFPVDLILPYFGFISKHRSFKKKVEARNEKYWEAQEGEEHCSDDSDDDEYHESLLETARNECFCAIVFLVIVGSCLLLVEKMSPGLIPEAVGVAHAHLSNRTNGTTFLSN